MHVDRLTVRDFRAYHKANPQVWKLFKKFTMQVIGRGYRHFGSGAIIERIRWFVNVETKNDPWKINNNYRSFYARKFMEMYPEYDGFFRRRESVADGMFPPGGSKRKRRKAKRKKKAKTKTKKKVKKAKKTRAKKRKKRSSR